LYLGDLDSKCYCCCCCCYYCWIISQMEFSV